METKSLYIACLSLSTSVDKMETKPIDKSRAVRQTKTVRNRIMRFWIPVCYLRIVISFPFVICQFDLSRVINTNGSDRTNRFCLLSVHSIQNHIPNHYDIHSWRFPVDYVSYPYNLKTDISKCSYLWYSLFWCAMTNLSILKLLKQILFPFCLRFVSICFQKKSDYARNCLPDFSPFRLKTGRLETKSP